MVDPTRLAACSKLRPRPCACDIAGRSLPIRRRAGSSSKVRESTPEAGGVCGTLGRQLHLAKRNSGEEVEARKKRTGTQKHSRTTRAAPADPPAIRVRANLPGWATPAPSVRAPPVGPEHLLPALRSKPRVWPCRKPDSHISRGP